MRKLATVRIIKDIQDIPNADKIQLAFVDGWQVVIRKGEFKVGDKCVYFEIDSILPSDKSWAEFMKVRKYRVKTIKLRGTLSQGLALPLSLVNVSEDTAVDTDLTGFLGVTKYDPDALKEQQEYLKLMLKKNKKVPWYFKVPLLSKILIKFTPKKSLGFPAYIPKTDENRVQNLSNLSVLLKDRELYFTEKIHGQPMTFFYNREEKVGLFKKGLRGICSRNRYYPTPVSNDWWNIEREFNLLDTLVRYCNEEKVSLAVQCEIVGPGMQGNYYDLSSNYYFVFSIYNIDKQKYLNKVEKDIVCDICGFNTVPFLGYIPKDIPKDVNFFLNQAEDYSVLTEKPCEGIVVRDWNDEGFSFKAINNEWLLKNE